MENLVDFDMTLFATSDNINGISYDKKSKSIIGKIQYDYNIKDVELPDGHYIDYNNLNSYSQSFKGYDDHRVIKVNISSFIGMCVEAVHHYVKIGINDLWINTPDKSRMMSTSYNFGFMMDLYMYIDDIDKKYFSKDELIYESTSRINSIEKLVKGVCEFINKIFDKNKFIIVIELYDVDVDENYITNYIEQNTGIKTFLK